MNSSVDSRMTFIRSPRLTSVNKGSLRTSDASQHRHDLGRSARQERIRANSSVRM